MDKFNRRLDEAEEKINKVEGSKKKLSREYSMGRQIENTEEEGLNKLKLLPRRR